MKYIKLFENFEDYNPYDLMVMFPDERFRLFIKEIKKPTSEQNLNLVRDLINLGTINTQDADDKTPLHWAATEWGSVEIARMLIDAGADLNIQKNGGSTPLLVATYYENVWIVRLLIDAGADLNLKDQWDWTPLHEAASNGRVEIARMLIDAGAKLNVQNKWGGTPLHVAAEFGKTEIAQTLIDAGADETILNGDGLRWDEVIDSEEFYDEDDD